jgi:predicted nucleic acid-binding protein
VDETFVLDSFAVLALLGREPGGQDAANLPQKAQEGDARVLMTWVNVGEVAYIVERRLGRERLYAALAVMEATALEIVPVERELALMAAHIKAEHAIAYADTLAAALAQPLEATFVTGDPDSKILEGVLDVHRLPQRL